MSKTNRSELRDALARYALEGALEYVAGWLATLGEAGSPPAKGKRASVPVSTRVSAAKVGLEFVTKFTGEAADTPAGQELLNALSTLEAEAAAVAEEPDDPERRESPDRPEDP